VVVIMTILAMATAQFGVTWFNNSRVSQAQSGLKQAYLYTKSAAIQNYSGQTGSTPSAVLCFSSAQMTVYSGVDCSGTIIWTAPVVSGVTTTFGSPGASPTCIALNNAGVPQAAAGATTCTTNLLYNLSAGTVNVSKTLY
jgi:type II secretory pathway pseudopilin PulG